LERKAVDFECQHPSLELLGTRHFLATLTGLPNALSSLSSGNRESSIERLVTGSSTTFELSYFFFIMCIRRTYDFFLSTVSIVAYDLLSSGDLGFQAFAAEDIDVVVSCWERAIHPNERVMVDRNPKLVIHSSLLELMGVKLWILRLSGVFRFTNPAMNPIDSNQEDRSVVVIIAAGSSPSLGPNDLEGS
jgi:hypothetical protein